MIIWGWKGRELYQRSGRFYCPNCASEQKYKLFRVSTYFTLYFIPLFETEHHGDYVKCSQCKGQFSKAVLDHKPRTQVESLVDSVQADLMSGTPLQMARTKLTNAGVDPEVAEKLLAVASGDEVWICSNCDLIFVPSVNKCSGCGTSRDPDNHSPEEKLELVPTDDTDHVVPESETPDPKFRHGCATAWLLLIIVGSSIALFLDLVFALADVDLMGKELKRKLVDVPQWVVSGAITLICLLDILFAVALMKWKKWGFYGFCTLRMVTVFTYLALDEPAMAGASMAGIVILLGVLSIGGDRNTWKQLE